MEICELCGHCCRDLIIEITEHDVLREPRLLAHAVLLDGDGEGGRIEYNGWDERLDRVYRLPSPCPFLVDNKCGIYPTRPNVCVGFEPGGEQCARGGRCDG